MYYDGRILLGLIFINMIATFFLWYSHTELWRFCMKMRAKLMIKRWWDDK